MPPSVIFVSDSFLGLEYRNEDNKGDLGPYRYVGVVGFVRQLRSHVVPDERVDRQNVGYEAVLLRLGVDRQRVV